MEFEMEESSLVQDRLTVLVVEDDMGYRELMVLMIKACGYQTLTASDGRQALKVIFDQEVHIISLDIMMPNMGGFEFLEELRGKAQAYDRTPAYIFIASARTDWAAKRRALELGVNGFLTKPFSFKDLQDEIKIGERFVRSKRALQVKET